jgi:uncharacterized protein
MRCVLSRWFGWLLLLGLAAGLSAEKPADLPIPTHYVNDFAGLLTPAGAARIEELCLAVQNQAGAQLYVVTVKSLDDDMTVEDFANQLEEHWKAGKKNVDREALIVLSANPRKMWIEIGYGLEGILPDAKVGGIRDQMRPLARAGDYDGAMLAGIQGLADVIAADKGVTLALPVHQYHYEGAPVRRRIGVRQILLGVGLVILLIILASTGNLGWAFWILLNLLGNGGGGGFGGGGGRDDDRGGGGFDGLGGGSSGGGGAGGDY